MKRICSILLAASSFLWTAPVVAEVRPHYGGTLRVAAKEAPGSLDPGSLAVTGPAGLTRVVFETLVKLDDHGYPHFHARHAAGAAKVRIDVVDVIDSSLTTASTVDVV